MAKTIKENILNNERKVLGDRNSVLLDINPKNTASENPATVIYSMAGMAAFGGIVMFVLSNRKLKKDKDQG